MSIELRSERICQVCELRESEDADDRGGEEERIRRRSGKQRDNVSAANVSGRDAAQRVPDRANHSETIIYHQTGGRKGDGFQCGFDSKCHIDHSTALGSR